jgi:uncharacterized coiled-coil protein SlyX
MSTAPHKQLSCPQCSAPIPSGQPFCGQCGFRVQVASLAGLSDRLAKIEAGLVASESASKITHQNYLEVDTAAKVMARVKTWTTLILYFAGIPAAVALLALAIVFGRGALDLRSIAANAKDSVNAILEKARTEASSAETTAGAVNRTIVETQQRVGELKVEVDRSTGKVRQLDGQVRAAQDQVAGLSKAVESQSQQIQHLSQQLKAAQTEKNVNYIREAYPGLFGQHVAGWRDGWIDPKAKATGDTYVAFILSNKPARQLSDSKVAEVMQTLHDHGYTLFVGGVSLSATSGRTSQGLGGAFDESSCSVQGTGLHEAPCILYFRERLKPKALEINGLLRAIETVPEDRIRFVSPEAMLPRWQELLQRSALDMVVVLN